MRAAEGGCVWEGKFTPNSGLTGGALAGRRGCAVGVVWRVLWGMGVMVSSAEGSLGGRGQRGALWEMGQSRLHSMKCPKLAFCAAAVSSNLYLNNWEIFVTCAILFYIVQPPI